MGESSDEGMTEEETTMSNEGYKTSVHEYPYSHKPESTKTEYRQAGIWFGMFILLVCGNWMAASGTSVYNIGGFLVGLILLYLSFPVSKLRKQFDTDE